MMERIIAWRMDFKNLWKLFLSLINFELLFSGGGFRNEEVIRRVKLLDGSSL